MTNDILPKTHSISIDELQELLCYDKDTGVLTWKTDGRRKKAGQQTGCLSYGYLHVNINRISFMAHRLAWALTYGKFPEKDIDHINGNKSDNRISNLRLASEVENGYNIPMKATNKSGFKGVYWHKGSNKWAAECAVNKRKHRLGRFDTAEEAGKAYEAFAKKHHGDFYFNHKGGVA